jgi:NTE family protein
MSVAITHRHTNVSLVSKGAALAATLLLLSSCTIWSGELGTSYQNRPDTGGSFVRPSVPVPRATTIWNADKPNFVGLAISGGGSRAANFGMAVLGELNAQGILPHVDAISAVSGGSIPAAWFALNGSEPDWFERGQAVANQNYLGSFILKMLNPTNLVMTTVTDKDRTDLLAEVFNDKVMGGQSVTFGALGARGPMRPAVYFNATDTTNGGERFVFSDDRFLRRLGSRLDEFPISMAMATSGAFPGVFNSVTLRKFSLDPAIRSQEEGLVAQRQYVHLIDGGSADNFGTDTLIDLARQHFIARFNRRQSPSDCMIMVIDSHVPNAAISDAQQSDRRNVFSSVIDLNFLDAIDALLSNRRNDALTAMGINRSKSLTRFNVNMNEQVIEYNITPYRRVSQFPILYYEQDGKAIDRPQFAAEPDNLELRDVQQSTPKTFMCTAWHIGLDDAHWVVPWKQSADGKIEPVKLRDPQDQQLLAYRVKLARVVKQVPTNYKLEGPKRCTGEFVQQALYDVAKIVVRQDQPSVTAVCDWFKQNGLDTKGQCGVDTKPVFRENYPIESIEVPRDLSANEQAIRRFVQCSTN